MAITCTACTLGTVLCVALVAIVFQQTIVEHGTVLSGVIAKVTCEMTYLQHLPVDAINSYELQHALWVTKVTYNHESTTVQANFLGLFTASARFMGSHFGCVLLPHNGSLPSMAGSTLAHKPLAIPNTQVDADAETKAMQQHQRAVDEKEKAKPMEGQEKQEKGDDEEKTIGTPYPSPPSTFGDGQELCPRGQGKLTTSQIDRIQALFDLEIAATQHKSSHSRAFALVQCGDLVAESYATWLNVSQDTRLLGWSMTKSVTSTLVGIRSTHVQDLLSSRVDVDNDGLDDNDKITLHHLLRMTDGLGYKEWYDLTSDPAMMLFAHRDVVEFTKSRGTKHFPGSKWCYHSGATNLASSLLRASFETSDEYWSFPYTQLFDKIGAKSFTLGADAAGTFVGSSFSFATARDWARFGALHLQHGKWHGEQIIPDAYFTEFETSRVSESSEIYSGGWWHPEAADTVNESIDECADRYRAQNLWQVGVFPEDSMYASGYKGQITLVLPTQKAVFVRLGHGWTRERELKFYTSLMEILNE
eukprot:m.360181 g.360181  ORF g.360181 m.360181 type:complete len:531 (+) comp18911_c0_seq1:230-1822(+)